MRPHIHLHVNTAYSPVFSDIHALNPLMKEERGIHLNFYLYSSLFPIYTVYVYVYCI